MMKKQKENILDEQIKIKYEVIDIYISRYFGILQQKKNNKTNNIYIFKMALGLPSCLYKRPTSNTVDKWINVSMQKQINVRRSKQRRYMQD